MVSAEDEIKAAKEPKEKVSLRHYSLVL